MRRHVEVIQARLMPRTLQLKSTVFTRANLSSHSQVSVQEHQASTNENINPKLQDFDAPVDLFVAC